jgi:hypothetical protein
VVRDDHAGDGVDVRLHDLESTHVTRRHLFVALSRATAFELVEVR